MAINHNPTRTRRIEKAWLRQINKRWREFTKNTMTRLRAMNAGESPLMFNANTPFTMNPEQIAAFMAYYQTEIDRLLLGSDNAPNWQAQYQIEAYTKGIERGRASLRAQGLSDQLSQTDFIAAQQFGAGAFTATPSLVSGGAAIAAPIHQETIEFLTSRSFDALDNWTIQMGRETQNILADGVRQGLGIDDVTKSITDRIGVSKSSAARIARTETIQGYQRAKINNAVEAEQQFGEPVVMRWITARDSRVRDQHAQWHGQLMSPQDAQINIGVSPYNCRCSLVEVIPEANTPERNAEFEKEREQLLKEEAERKQKERAERTEKIVEQAKKEAVPGNKPRPQGFFDADPQTKEWVNASLNDPRYNKLVGEVGTPSSLVTTGGSYWQGGTLAMNHKLKPGTNKGDATYRHEFGHHVDLSRSGAGLSQTVDFENLRKADEKHLKGIATTYFNAAKKRHPNAYLPPRYSQRGWVLANQLDLDVEKQLFVDSGMDLKAYAFANVKKGSAAERMLKKYNWDLFAPGMMTDNKYVLNMVVADKHDNLPLLTHTLGEGGSKIIREGWKESSQLSDLAAAITHNKFGSGHSNSYWSEKWNGISTNKNAESFAQLFSLNDIAAGSDAAQTADEIAPNMNKWFLGLIK